MDSEVNSVQMYERRGSPLLFIPYSAILVLPMLFPILAGGHPCYS
ncbi:Uncharacterised protein [Vibrio cholerae]|nr:Uncharacterised protein [Vibrio cholerae]